MIHTVSLFPSLLDFQLFAPLVLRIAAGVFLFLIGFDSVKKLQANEDGTTTEKRPVIRTAFGIATILISLAIIVGAFTQGAALLAIVLIVLNTLTKGKMLDTSGTSGDAQLLIIIICIALLLFGAGMPAIDLPL